MINLEALKVFKHIPPLLFLIEPLLYVKVSVVMVYRQEGWQHAVGMVYSGLETAEPLLGRKV